MSDETGFRVGHSHGDIVYHHVEGRNKNDDPRYAVCQSKAEALEIVKALNFRFSDCTEEDFKNYRMRW